MKGHIRKRGDRSWSIVLELERGPDGKRKQKWHTVKGTKRDAERELARLVNEFNQGAYVEPHKLTLGEFLENWLENAARMRVSEKTRERYGDYCRKHFIPALGHVSLQKLHPMQIQSFYTDALKSGRLDGKGGLSARTVHHMHRVLNTALEQAVRWQLIIRNPVHAVTPPKPQYVEIGALDEARIGELLSQLGDNPLYRPVFLALATGVRRGELLALKWSNLSWNQKTISVREMLEQTRSGLRFKAPKTAKGRRAIDLPEVAIEVLRQQRAEQREFRVKMGPDYEDNDLIFALPDGCPWPPDRFSTHWAGFCRRNGFKGLRFHDLRHTHATQLLSAGVHPKVVSERLGHAGVGITLDTYSHVLPGIQREAAERINLGLTRAMSIPSK